MALLSSFFVRKRNGEGDSMEVKSSAYRAGGLIPVRYTSEGEDISPDFSWKDAPPGTHSFVLVFHDAEHETATDSTRWVLYNIDPILREIEEDTPRDKTVGVGVQGTNDLGVIGYSGPSRSTGERRYTARLFALDTELDLKPGASYSEVYEAMQGHILDRCALMGRFSSKTAEQMV
jgi:Raf kinase inhibitor-like YbhB/YbcL family protein